MCHGHPRNHPCSHASVHWHYCPSAVIDLTTGYESPCQNQSFAKSQQSNANCPLTHCNWNDLGGSWICCACGLGPNKLGWCTTPVVRERTDPLTMEPVPRAETCDHGCCDRCEPTEDSISLAGSISDLKKSSKSSRSSRPRSSYSKNGFELDGPEATLVVRPKSSKSKISTSLSSQGRPRVRTSNRRERR